MKLHVTWDAGAYLTAGDIWICLSLGQPQPAKDYTHVAFNVCSIQFAGLLRRLQNAGVEELKKNTSEGDAIYVLDPEGHRLELHWRPAWQSCEDHPKAGWYGPDICYLKLVKIKE